ncbi:MAG: branched-chain amino acid transaminase [Candidatus Altimarinota bacterium]
MQKTKFIWLDGTFVPWDKANIHVLNHSLHYGGAVFEGIRVYETDQGPAIFRLKEHTKRLLYSAKALKMKLPYTEKELNETTLELVRKNKLKHGYIRPIIFHGQKMGLNPIGAPLHVAIACWPWGKYLSEDPIKVKISSFVRIHPKSSVTDAKISGHYANSIMAVLEIAGTKYQEALLLDYQGYVAEGPGENFFMVKKGVLYTPSLGTILHGITRDTILALAKDLKIAVKEAKLKPKDLFGADEAFFTGTAAEVTPIASIDDHVFNKGKEGPITAQLKQAYMEVVHGKNPRYKKYLTLV